MEQEKDYITSVDIAPLCVHDVFVVPKGDGGGRVVVDCSRPRNKSVNNYTESVKLKFSYKSLAHVTDLLKPNDYVATVDIKGAYRAVKIHPDDRKFQSLHHSPRGGPLSYFEDNRLCMGLSSSPFIFQRYQSF